MIYISLFKHAAPLGFAEHCGKYQLIVMVSQFASPLFWFIVAALIASFVAAGGSCP